MHAKSIGEVQYGVIRFWKILVKEKMVHAWITF